MIGVVYSVWYSALHMVCNSVNVRYLHQHRLLHYDSKCGLKALYVEGARSLNDELVYIPLAARAGWFR